MDLGLTGKSVIVTGGAKGIGEAIVGDFANEGARIIIANRPGVEGPKLADELQAAGVDARFRATELRDEEECKQLIDFTVEAFGGIDVLVNNAGVNDGVDLSQPLDRFIDSLRSNLFHVYVLAHHALPHLKASQGNIVNVSSKVADTGQGKTSGYAAAKGAVNGLTREWAVALAPFHIRVNTVSPAEVMTPLYEKWLKSLDDPSATQQAIEKLIPLGNRFTTKEEIAAMVVFLASERSGHTTGQIIYPDGGYVHLDRAIR